MPDQPMNRVLGPCLDSETMAAYLDNRLDVSARHEVEAHLAECETCYELVTETLQTEEEAFGSPSAAPSSAPPASPTSQAVTPQTQVPRIRPGHPRWMAAGGGLLALAAALLLVVRTQPVWWQGLWQTPEQQRMAALVEAVGEERFVEARLTGGFKYGPFHSPTRSGVDTQTENLSLLAAAGELQRRAEAAPTPEHQHALGLAFLSLGQIDRAIDTLSPIVRNQPSAPVLSDLAAALFARAATGRHGDDLAAALENVEAALRMEPEFPEALFNRALILDEFGLSSQAREAWEAFLAVDSASAWAKEARERLESFKGSAVAPAEELVAFFLSGSDRDMCAFAERDGQFARESVEDELLPRWADQALEGGKNAAEALLSASRRLARCLTASSGDRSTEHGVAVVEQSDDVGRTQLASAYQRWRTGRSAYARGAPSEFGPAFAEAAKVFDHHRSPMTYWARQYAVAAAFFTSDLPSVERLTAQIMQDLPLEDFDALRGRLRWNVAAVRFQQARFGRRSRSTSSPSRPSRRPTSATTRRRCTSRLGRPWACSGNAQRPGNSTASHCGSHRPFAITGDATPS